jgi:hypothetical protein
VNSPLEPSRDEAIIGTDAGGAKETGRRESPGGAEGDGVLDPEKSADRETLGVRSLDGGDSVKV